MEATFLLKRQIDGRGHFAMVSVRAAPASREAVTVADDAFAWRRDTYGPGASVATTADAGMCSEAAAGVREALIGHPPHCVTITEIVESLADTCPGDIQWAAREATRRALVASP